MPGLAIILVALFMGFLENIFVRIPNGKAIKGEVVSMKSKKTKGTIMYRPTVCYIVNGQEYYIEDNRLVYPCYI